MSGSDQNKADARLDEILVEIFASDLNLFANILDTFSRTRIELLEKMSQAYEARDFETMEIVAHAMKGTVSVFHREDLRSILATIESEAREKSLDWSKVDLENLKTLSEELMFEVRAYLNKRQAQAA